MSRIVVRRASVKKIPPFPRHTGFPEFTGRVLVGGCNGFDTNCSGEVSLDFADPTLGGPKSAGIRGETKTERRLRIPVIGESDLQFSSRFPRYKVAASEPVPELPEVETMVRGIRADCSGRIIRGIEFVRSSKKPIQVIPERPMVRKLAEGCEMSEVRRIAKRVVLMLNSGHAFVIEPRMTGLMLISDPPTQDHRRVVWHFDPVAQRSDSLEFWDRRGLGTVSLLSPEQLETLQQQFGPDALQIDQDELQHRLKQTNRAIKVTLLDQSLVAGIGNLYASEILHRSGISPRRRASALTKPQVARIVESTHIILNEAIRYEGSTLGDGTYRNALNKDGGYQNHHKVYQRADEVCPTCHQGTIKRIMQTQRSTFYCPKCQR